MARRIGEPASSRVAKSKSVSPAIAVIVIVIVLALVAVVWLRFTQVPANMAESEYEIRLDKLKPNALETTEGKAIQEKVRKSYLENRKKREASGINR